MVSLYYVACVLTICLLCCPINYNWNRSIEGSCGNVKAIELFSAAFNMLLDVWVVFLPLPIVAVADAKTKESRCQRHFRPGFNVLLTIIIIQ